MSKKNKEDYTLDEQEWERRMLAAKANKPNAHAYFNNVALTKAGELCLGMTHDTQHNHYSCTYMEVNGVRDFGGCRRWNLQGHSLDGLSALRLSTVQVGVRKI